MTREEAKKAKDKLYNADFDYDGDALIDKIFDEFEEEKWHTGTPTEAGLYVIAFRFGNKIEHEIREMFYSPDYGMTFGIKKDIVAWLKIEPYKEASK